MYSPEDKKHALQLRLSGKSYTEIKKIIGIRSKSTLSVWFRDLKLTPEARILLKENIDRATKQKLLAFNVERSKRIRSENESSRKTGMKAIGGLSKRDLLITGVALYWGEGTKSERSLGYNSLSFSNSDPAMIKTFMRFLREVMNVPEEKIRALIHIYPDIDKESAIVFWQRTTGIAFERFTVSFQASRAGKGIRKTLPYGTLNVRVHNRHLFYRMKGMIDGLGI